MATTVNVEGIGQLVFPDGMTEQDMLGAIENNFPNWRDATVSEKPIIDSGKGVVMDSISRFGRGAAKHAGEGISGIAFGAEIAKSQGLPRNLRSIRMQAAMAGQDTPETGQLVKRATAEAPKRALTRREESIPYQFGQDIQQTAQDYYQPNPAMDNTIRAKFVEAASSVIPVLASGPLAPLTYAGMMGESGAKEAELKGASPEKIVSTFLANAALGVTSEFLLGVPYLLRSIKAVKGAGEAVKESSGAIKKRLSEIYKNHPIASLAARGAIAEGIQEGPIEQTGQNAIAKWVGEFDPDRPLFQNVGEQAAYGAAIGLLVGTGFGAASSIDQKRKHERGLERLEIDVAARMALDPRQAQLTREGPPTQPTPLLDIDAFLAAERLRQQSIEKPNVTEQTIVPQIPPPIPEGKVAEEITTQVEPKVLAQQTLPTVKTAEAVLRKSGELYRAKDSATDYAELGNGIYATSKPIFAYTFGSDIERLSIAKQANFIDEGSPEHDSLLKASGNNPEVLRKTALARGIDGIVGSDPDTGTVIFNDNVIIGREEVAKTNPKEHSALLRGFGRESTPSSITTVVESVPQSVRVPPPLPPKEAPTGAPPASYDQNLKIGDPLRVMDVDSVLAKTATVGGVRYELFNGAQLKEPRSAIRVTDVGSGQQVTLKQFPSYDSAEAEFDQTIAAVTPKPPKPARQGPELPHDVITAIKQLYGAGKLSLASAQKFEKGFKPMGSLLRNLFTRTGGYNLDDVLSALHLQGEFLNITTETELLDALKGTPSSRVAFRGEGTQQRKLIRRELDQLADFTDIAIRNKRAKKKKSDAIPVEELLTGSEFQIAGEKFVVKKLVFDEDTQELLEVVAEDGKRFGVQRIGGKETLHADKGTFVQHEPSTEFLDPQEEAMLSGMLGMPVKQHKPKTKTTSTAALTPAAPLPKLRRGETQGDVFATQAEPLALVGEQGKDFERIQREKEAAAKLKAEADVINAAKQRPLFAGATETGQGLVDSQPLIDTALTTGGGEAAFKALVLNVRIRYGPLPPGVPAEYQDGVITLNKPVIDFIATRWPQQAQAKINELISEELTHAIADTVLTTYDYIRIGETMSEADRQAMFAERPEIANILNRVEQNRHLGGEFVAKRLLKENETAHPIDPNSPFGQRVLAALQKLWDYLAAALKRFANRNTIIEVALAKVRKAKADVLAGKLPVFEKGDPLNARALIDALTTFRRETAEGGIGDESALRKAQAGEVLAQLPQTQATLQNLQTRANLPKSASLTSQQRFDRDVAQRVLRNPFIRRNLLTQSEHLDAAINALNGDLETFERLAADKASTPEEIGTAAGNAFETLQTFEQTKADLFDAIDKRRPQLIRELAKTFDAEAEALENRDVYQVLLKDFQEMGRLLVKVQKDRSVLSAYKQALGSKDGTRNVLKFLHDHIDFSGMTYDDLRSVDDLWDRIRLYIVNNTGKFPAWDGSVERLLGAGEDVIRAVLRIVALSEPIRTELEAAKLVAAGIQYAAPFSRIKTKLGQELQAGHYAGALTLYEKGIADTSIGLKESRDAANFYAKDTRRILINIKTLDEARAIAVSLSADPELVRQANNIYRFHNIAKITHGKPAKGASTTVEFLRANPADPPIAIEFGNGHEAYLKGVEKALTIASEYQAYIANDDTLGYDPRLAAGMKKSLEKLVWFTDPSRNPKIRARLLPGFSAKTFDWISSKLSDFALIPKFATIGAVGHMADVELTARSAWSVVAENAGRILISRENKLSDTLKSALKSHGDMLLGQYHLKVFNPLASSRQNFNNASILKPGDGIGNGERVTAEDMRYLKEWRDYETELFHMVNSTGKKQFQSVKMMFAGILFDKNGMVRTPITHGPDMTGRDFPPVLQLWVKDWFDKPAQRVEMIDFWKDPLLIGYIRGSREVDWKGGYAYALETRQIARDMAEDPIVNFEDFVTRVFDLYTAREGVETKDMAEIQADILADFDTIFTKAKPFAEQGGDNPKTDTEIIGGNNSFNTPRSTLIMPPGWYNYGGVTAGDRVAAGRAATIGFQLAYRKAVEALRDSLFSVVTAFEGQRTASGITEGAQYSASKKERQAGDILYDLGEAERLLRNVDHLLSHIKIMMSNSANPYVKDSVHMAMMRGGAQFVITSVVSGPAAVTKNIGGGYQNLAMLDVLIRRKNLLWSIATRGGDAISSGLKELVYLALHDGNPATRGLRTLLENPQNVTFIGDVAKLFLGYANKLRADYNYAEEAGVNYNVNLWETTKARWKFSKTLGQPRNNDPRFYEAWANQLSLLGNTGAQYVGQATVGHADIRLNTKAIMEAGPIEKNFRDIAIEFGDKMEASGLFPDKAISKGAFSADVSAAYIRDFFRRGGIGSIDAIMADFHRRWTEDKGKEQGQGLTEGALSSKTRLFTDPQFNQLEQVLAEDVNLPTYSTRPTFGKQSRAHSQLMVLWGWPSWFIQKLLHLADKLSNKREFAGFVKNMPTLIQIGLLMAITAPLIYGAASFIKRLFENKVTGFPTVFDAQNPKQAAQAILAATADSIPFIGTAVNMVTGAGYRTGFDINSQFLLLNLAGDATRTYKEVMQTGDLGGPIQRFGSRYFFPLNVVGGRLPSQSGNREFSNTRNILTMGARGTGLETKIRRTGGGGITANYSASTPLVNRAMNALGRNDSAAFQAAYADLVEQKRATGSLNPGASALTALRARNPITSVFGSKLEPDELDRVLNNVSPALAQRARLTIQRYDAALATLPRRTTSANAGISRTRRGTRAVGFRMRRGRLRAPSLRLKKPRLRRLTV